MLDGTCRPRSDLFVEDGLHLNGWGYRLWTEVVSAWLDKRVASMAL